MIDNQPKWLPGVSFLLAVLFVSPCAAESSETANLVETAVNARGEAQYTAIDDLGERREAPRTVVPNLQVLLASDDPQVRWRTARALGDYGIAAKSTSDDLRKLLDDSDPIVRYHAAIALGKIGDSSEATMHALASAATGNDQRVARAAIGSIANLKPGPEQLAKVLNEVLEADDDAVALHALQLVVERGRDAVPLLNEALKQPKTAVLAVAAIEKIGPPAAPTVPALSNILIETQHSQMLIQTLLALASIGPAAEPATPQIVPLLESSTDETVPVAAAYALGSIRGNGADEALRKAAQGDNDFLKMVASWALARIHPDDEQLTKQAIDQLIEGLGSDEVHLRTAAAKGLQKLDAPAELVAPALMARANDPDPHVASNVVSALASLGESIVPRLTQALSNRERRTLAVRVLTQLGPEAASAVPSLIQAAGGADSEFQTEVNFALAAIGPAAAPATEMLVQAMANEHQAVRESALYALRRVGPGAAQAIEPLVARAESDDSFEAMAAAWALAKIAPENENVANTAVPVLIEGLASPNERVQLESAEALADLGPAAHDALSPLERVAESDDSPVVRQAAQHAARQISN